MKFQFLHWFVGTSKPKTHQQQDNQMSMPSKTLLLEEQIDKIVYWECDLPFHPRSNKAKQSKSTGPEIYLKEFERTEKVPTSGMIRFRIKIKTVSPMETKENDVSLPTKIPNRSANNPKQKAPTPNVILAVVKIELKSSSLSLQFNWSPFWAPKISDGPNLTQPSVDPVLWIALDLQLCNNQRKSHFVWNRLPSVPMLSTTHWRNSFQEYFGQYRWY